MYRVRKLDIEIDDTYSECITFGTGKKKLILIPGVGEGLITFKGKAIPFSILYRTFAKEYTVYVFSRRRNMKKGFSTKDMANDIINHMEKLKIKEANVVGVSQGGMIAQYVAINAPEKVKKLVLVVTTARSNNILKETIEDWIEKAKNKDYKGIMVDTAERSYTGKYLNKSRKLYKLMGMMGKNALYDRFIIEANSCLNHNSYDELNKIECPTLIIGAKLDKALGIIGSEELSKKIKNSELYIYEEYSHGVYEQAKDFNDRIKEFLK